MPENQEKERQRYLLGRQRWAALRQIEDWLEVPLLVLSLAWLVLLIVELVSGLTPLLQGFVTIIWIIFIIDFVLRLVLAPDKWAYFKANWLTSIALLLPALRVLRVVRLVRLARLARPGSGVFVLRIVTALNRGMATLRRTTAGKALPFAIALTVLVTLAGAAGMYALERFAPESQLTTYGDALWWTATVMTTIGPPSWPQTGEGRLLAVLLATYAFAIFGYLAGTLAALFIDQQVRPLSARRTSTRAIHELSAEIAALRAEIRTLRTGRGEDEP